MDIVEVAHGQDRDGNPIVCVPLTNAPDQKVQLNRDDFDLLIEMGLDPRWKLENGQILERGTRLSITRLVADAKSGEKIHLIDGDPTNLKQNNFLRSKGGSGSDAREQLSPLKRPDKFRRFQIKHKNINPPWHDELRKEKQANER